MIFQVLGTPQEDDIAFVTDEKASKYLMSFKKMEREDLAQRYKGASGEAVDLLNKMLQFNPFFRIPVDEALEHPFFKKIRKTEKEKVAKEPVGLEFEEEVMGVQRLRELFLNAIVTIK